jgi:hypothetical protein
MTMENTPEAFRLRVASAKFFREYRAHKAECGQWYCEKCEYLLAKAEDASVNRVYDDPLFDGKA